VTVAPSKRHLSLRRARFVVCGVSRLARFNVTAEELSDAATGKVKYF